MRVPCASKISPDCEQAIDIRAYQEYDEPMNCLSCEEHINNLLRRLKNENPASNGQSFRLQSQNGN